MSGKFNSWVIAALVFVDVVTLVLAIVIAAHQGDTLQQVDDRSCRNSGILIRTIQRQVVSTNRSAVYRDLFPQVSQARLQLIIAHQVNELRHEIHELSQGCSTEQLNAA